MTNNSEKILSSTPRFDVVEREGKVGIRSTVESVVILEIHCLEITSLFFNNDKEIGTVAFELFFIVTEILSFVLLIFPNL